jgi:WD40 repeat protein
VRYRRLLTLAIAAALLLAVAPLSRQGSRVPLRALADEEKVRPIPIAELKRDKPVSFFEEVLPILEEKCLACHSTSLAESKLNLEEVRTMLKGGKRGPAITPGKGAESLLIKVASRQIDPPMPPPNRKDYKPLSPEELGLIKLWIDQGAQDDGGEATSEKDVQLVGLPPNLNAVLAVAVSPDGRYVAAGRGNLVHVYDLQSGTEVATLKGHVDFVQSLAWSPDGRLLASGSYRLVKLWQAPQDRELRELVDFELTRGLTAHLEAVTDLVLHPQGNFLLSAGRDGRLRFWNPTDGSLQKSVDSPLGPVTDTAVSPDGGRLYLGSGTQIAVIEQESAAEVRRWSLEANLEGFALSPDGSMLAVAGSSGKVYLLTTPLVKKLGATTTAEEVAATAVDGKGQLWVATVSGSVKRLERQPNGALSFTNGPQLPGRPHQLAVNPDATLLAAAVEGGKLVVVRLQENLSPVALDMAKPVVGLNWSLPQQLLVATEAPSLEVFNVTFSAGAPANVQAAASIGLPAKPLQIASLPPMWKGVLVAVEGGKWLDIAEGGTVRGELGGLGAAPSSSAVSSDGKWLAAVCVDGKTRLWDLASRTMVAELGTPEATNVAWEPGSSYVVALSGKVLFFIDPPQRSLIFTSSWGSAKVLGSAGVGPSRFAVVFTSGLEEWQWEPGRLVGVCEGHTGPVRGVAFAAGGQELSSWSADGTVRVWSVAERKQLRSVSAHGGAEVLAAAISPDGAFLATGGADNRVLLWNFRDLSPYPGAGEAQRTFGTFQGPVRTLAYSQDGTQLAAGATDGRMAVWEPATGRVLHQFAGHVGPVHVVVFGPSSSYLASGGADSTIRIWSTATDWVEIRQWSGQFVHRVLTLDFSPDGRLLACGGGEPSRSGEIKIFSVTTGELVREFPEAHSDTVFGLDFSPDGTMLATCAADKLAKVLDLASGQELRKLEGHTHHVLDVVWRWDGAQVITCGADNTLKVWDFRTGEQLLTIGGHVKQVTSLVALPRSNEVISCGADAQVRRFNTDNGGTVRGYGGSRDYLYSVSIDGEGRWVVAAGQDSILRIWDANTGNLVRTISPPPAQQLARQQ